MSDAILPSPAPHLPSFGAFGRGFLGRLRAFRCTDAPVETLVPQPPPDEQGVCDPLRDQKLLTHDIARECVLHLVESLQAAYPHAGTLHLDNVGPDADERCLASGVIKDVGVYIDTHLQRIDTALLFTDFPDFPSIEREAIARGFVKPSAHALAGQIITDLARKRAAGYNLVVASRSPLSTVPGTPGRCTVVARYQGFTLQAMTQWNPGVPTVQCCIEVLYGVDVLTPDTVVAEAAD